jgi:outer membrane receptor protein involved in Fe transport
MGCLLAATVMVWWLGASEGLAQDQGLDAPSVDRRKNAEAPSSAAEVAKEPGQAGESPAAEEEPASTKVSAAPKGRVIEEIVVTAQRTEQQLHDVPISMSAFDDRFLQNQGIHDLGDLARYAPNVRVDLSGTYIQPRIRGFSTNTVVNRGLELPVGIVVDEIPYSRADYFASGLFDLDRVEVLRGPQGQLFGANTTVGLLNLVTKNPTDEFTGFVDTEIGELGRRRLEGGIGGPLLRGNVRFRIAGLSDERGDYIENTTARILPGADEALGSLLRQSVRAKLDFPNLFGGSLLVSYQRDVLDVGPQPQELTSVPAGFQDLMRRYDPQTDFVPGNFVASLDAPSFRKADIDTFTAIARYDLGGWGLNLAGGWSGLRSASSNDADGGPWPSTKVFVDETGDQTTGELRVTSPDLSGFLGIGNLFGWPLGSSDFTSGFFYQRRTQSPTDAITTLDANLVLLLEAIDMGAPVPPARPPSKFEFFTTDFDQTANELAGYGQMNWRFLDRWTLIGGMRVSHTAKEASWVQKVASEDGSPSLLSLLGVVDSYVDAQSNGELHFAPKGGLKFDWSENLNFYGIWAEGYQAGGFNNFSNSSQPRTRVVDPAFVDSWEAGSKTKLLDGTAELNLSLFWMTMKDFQLFTVAALPGEQLPVSRVINVGRLRARGFEVDSTWLPTDWLTIRGALGFNDTKYLEFPFGTCIGDRPNTDGDGDPRCDLAGRPLEQAPKWDTSFTTVVRIPLTSIPGLGPILPAFVKDVDLTNGLSVQYTDNRYLNDSDDPRTRQPSFFLLDGSIGFGSESRGWSLQLRVENLTDETYHNTSFEGVPANGVIWKGQSPPRHVFGGLRWEF